MSHQELTTHLIRFQILRNVNSSIVASHCFTEFPTSQNKIITMSVYEIISSENQGLPAANGFE